MMEGGSEWRYMYYRKDESDSEATVVGLDNLTVQRQARAVPP
jgi:hypothetical protein